MAGSTFICVVRMHIGITCSESCHPAPCSLPFKGPLSEHPSLTPISVFMVTLYHTWHRHEAQVPAPYLQQPCPASGLTDPEHPSHPFSNPCSKGKTSNITCVHWQPWKKKTSRVGVLLLLLLNYYFSH